MRGRSEKRKTRRKRSRRGTFLRGLVVLLPAILTVFVFVTVLQFVHTYVTSPINGAIYGLLEGNALGWRVLATMEVDPYDRAYLDKDRLPPQLADELATLGGSSAVFQEALDTWRAEQQVFFRDFDRLAIDGARLRKATSAHVSPLIGIVLSGVLVLTLGYFTSGFLGRQAISAFDRALNRLPVVRSVYPYTKQLVDFFLSDNEMDFDTVVAAPYPSQGVWCIGFVTGEGLRTLHGELGGRYLSVFIPTSPMPMTGFTVFFEADKLIPLDLSVDEALRVTMSAGVLVPESEQPNELEHKLRTLGEQAGEHERPAEEATA